MISKEASVSVTEGTLINTKYPISTSPSKISLRLRASGSLLSCSCSRQQMLPLGKFFSLTLNGASRLTDFVAQLPLTEGVDPFGDKA